MNFRVLPSQLHPIAEEVARFFKDDRGLTRFKVEESVSNDLGYRPTLQTTTPEHYDLWIEVSELPYLSSLDGVVLHCVANCLPVKLFVAFPVGLPATEYKRHVDEARTKGVGALEVYVDKTVVIHEARLLSLIGVRSEDRSQFPSRYRSVLSTAETTFRSGDPAKGCSLVYDEIEALSRRLAAKIQKNGWWTHLTAGVPAFKPEKDPWSNVMEVVVGRTDFNRLPVGIRRNLLIRVAALTDVRNDSGHKPKNRAAYIRRDRELRTRFETAVDVLRDLANAARPLRI